MNVDPAWRALRRGSPEWQAAAAQIGRLVLDQTAGEWVDPTTEDLVLETVAAAYGVTRDQVVQPGRARAAVDARQLSAYLLREVCGLSSPQIAGVLQRDHTTVVHAWTRISDRIADDSLFGAFVLRLQLQIEARIRSE